MAIYHIEREGIRIFTDPAEARHHMAISHRMECTEAWPEYQRLAALRLRLFEEQERLDRERLL